LNTFANRDRSRYLLNTAATEATVATYQVTLLVSIAAAGLTVLWMRGNDLSFLTMDYRTWRLLSACLLHAGYVHLIFNLYWTWRFGSVLEPIFGTLAMTGIFVFLGAGSMGAEWALGRGGVRLSGVGYGLFGLAYTLDRWHPSYRGILDERTTVMFVVWFFVCIAATVADVMPIANAAHGAGALLGALLGLALSPFPRRRMRGRIGLGVAAAALALACTVGRPYVNLWGARAWELGWDGYVALKAGDLETAVRCYEASVERDPEYAHAWHNLGVAYARLGRVQDSLRARHRAAQLEGTAREGTGAERRPMFQPLLDFGRKD
jgi:membrane associated rhomboid family serine protease